MRKKIHKKYPNKTSINKNIITEMTDTLDRVNSRLDIAQENISELRNTAIQCPEMKHR